MTTTDPAASTIESVRILHWNVHSWRDETGQANVDSVAELISETQPDVISLVEVDEPRGNPTTLNELANRNGYAWTFVPTFEFGSSSSTGGFGNALLTRLPLLAVQQWNLLWPPRIYDGSEPSEPRSALAIQLDTQPHPIWTVSTHLPRHHVQARTDALHNLLALTQPWHSWLICGDFNTPSATWTHDHPVTVAPHPPQPTHGDETIDYCVASPTMTLHADALTAPGSDHYPVLIRATPQEL